MPATKPPKVQFIVQPFATVKGKRLSALQAQAFTTAEAARRAGERMARTTAGVVVLSQEFDPDADFAAEPVVLATHGTVPHEIDDLARLH